MGWRLLASDIWSALLKLGTAEEVFRQFRKYEDFVKTPGLRPLQSVFQQEDGHLFVYGHFFATLNIGDAYKYAVCNPFRSEFLWSISVGLKFLARCDAAPTVRELEGRYPEIMELINWPPAPVVVELKGIEKSRLSNEDGSKAVVPRIISYLSKADNSRTAP